MAISLKLQRPNLPLVAGKLDAGYNAGEAS
jgi:hypothetical protein